MGVARDYALKTYIIAQNLIGIWCFAKIDAKIKAIEIFIAQKICCQFYEKKI